MRLHFSIIRGEEMYGGSIKEYPGVLTQGRTAAETKENLLDALQLYQECEVENKPEKENDL